MSTHLCTYLLGSQKPLQLKLSVLRVHTELGKKAFQYAAPFAQNPLQEHLQLSELIAYDAFDAPYWRTWNLEPGSIGKCSCVLIRFLWNPHTVNCLISVHFVILFVWNLMCFLWFCFLDQVSLQDVNLTDTCLNKGLIKLINNLSLFLNKQIISWYKPDLDSFMNQDQVCHLDSFMNQDHSFSLSWCGFPLILSLSPLQKS